MRCEKRRHCIRAFVRAFGSDAPLGSMIHASFKTAKNDATNNATIPTPTPNQIQGNSNGFFVRINAMYFAFQYIPNGCGLLCQRLSASSNRPFQSVFGSYSTSPPSIRTFSKKNVDFHAGVVSSKPDPVRPRLRSLSQCHAFCRDVGVFCYIGVRIGFFDGTVIRWVSDSPLQFFGSAIATHRYGDRVRHIREESRKDRVYIVSCLYFFPFPPSSFLSVFSFFRPDFVQPSSIVRPESGFIGTWTTRDPGISTSYTPRRSKSKAPGVRSRRRTMRRSGTRRNRRQI